MKAMKVVWNKVSERYYSSLLFRFGIPTFLGGLILGVPALLVGYNLHLFDVPEYWRGLGFPITLIVVGTVSMLWGWFRDPAEERGN